MALEPLRFIHASDFHLERVPAGLSEVPDHLRDLLAGAAYQAATRVFDAALSERVDFLVLSGDLFHPLKAGPRALVFLAEQLQRLADSDIPVFWATGRAERVRRWPEGFAWPRNVHLFSSPVVEERSHRKEGSCTVRIVGRGYEKRRLRAADLEPSAEGQLTLGIAYRKPTSAALSKTKFQYWALGGTHNRQTPASSPQTVHFAGSPQARGAGESGPHGCTLVTLDAEGRTSTTFVPTDVVRWHRERVNIDETMDRAGLERRLCERTEALIQDAQGVKLLLHWDMAGTGPVVTQLRRGMLAGELTSRLRNLYGFGDRAAWTVSVQAESSAILPAELVEQKTFLGDFLRAVRRRQAEDSGPLDLMAHAEVAPQLVAVGDTAARQRVWSKVALLGVDLLAGEEPQR